MRRWTTIIFALLMTCAAARGAPQGAGPAPLDTMPAPVRNAAPCLVQVVGVFDGNRRVVGTGFLISGEGHVLTSARAIERATEVFVCAPALGDLLVQAREIDNRKTLDVSLLKADLPGKASGARICETVSSGPGDVCYPIGFMGEGADRVAGGVKAVIVGDKSFPGRGHLIQFGRPFPASFLGGPILSSDGAVLGLVTPEPPGAPGEAGWCVPVSAVKEMLELNGVRYTVEYSLWSYMTWGMAISFVIVALLIYGAYALHIWQTQGRRAALKRLPAKGIALCLLAAGLFHLIAFLVILVKQQEWGVGAEEPELAEVGVVAVGEGGEGVGLPDAGVPSAPRPSDATRPAALRAPVQNVDVSQTIQEKVKETVKNVGEGAERTDAEAEAASRAQHEGVLAGAQRGARGRGEATAGMKARMADLEKRLAEAERKVVAPRGAIPGPSAPAERTARRERWLITFPAAVDFFGFIDLHKAELATCSDDEPDTLYYLSDLTGVMNLRAGRASQEPRMHWAPVGFDMRREQEEAAFRSVGRKVGPDDPILVFFPKAFEDVVAKLEKEYRAARGFWGTPKRTFFIVDQDLQLEVTESR